MIIPRILITPGEPAGVGVDVAVRIAQQAWPAELVVIADPELLLARAKQIGLPLQLVTVDLSQSPTQHQPGTLKIIPVALSMPATAGKLDVNNAAYVLKTLEIAASLCEQQQANAIVTGPVHKEIMNQAGIAFSGHTEFFAQHASVPQTVMLFVVDQLKVALVTTHLPLVKVSAAITANHLRSVLTIVHNELKKKFHLAEPRIAICGLNPHAGEGGYLGREEIDIMIPVINELRQEMNLLGPLPADTIFTPAILSQTDIILGMYHDQVLPVVKYLGFDRAVNVTLGLPYIRTSVDHGTALDIAGTSTVNSGSMQAAIHLAISMSKINRS